jgi:hypothetical protein
LHKFHEMERREISIGISPTFLYLQESLLNGFQLNCILVAYVRGQREKYEEALNLFSSENIVGRIKSGRMRRTANDERLQHL